MKFYVKKDAQGNVLDKKPVTRGRPPKGVGRAVDPHIAITTVSRVGSDDRDGKALSCFKLTDTGVDIVKHIFDIRREV